MKADLTAAGLYEGEIQTDDGYDRIMGIFKKYELKENGFEKFTTLEMLKDIFDYDINGGSSEQKENVEFYRSLVGLDDFYVFISNFDYFKPFFMNSETAN